MSSTRIYDDFINLNKLSKTLRFELIPQGKTLEHIRNKGLIEEDSTRAEEYKVVKKIIDRYHKQFIDETLSEFKFENLNAFYTIYTKTNKTDADKNDFEKIEGKLRKEIANNFKQGEKYKTIFKKELIKKDLVEFVKDNEEELKVVRNFSNFTTYFKGFNENRENMYSDEAKSTAISYRIINENLPKFIDNTNTFLKIKRLSSLDLNCEIDEMIKKKTDIEDISEVFDLEFFNKTITQSGIDKYNAVIGGYDDGKEKFKGLNQYINEFNQKAGKNQKLPLFKVLYKQILDDKTKISFVPEKFKTDQELIDCIKEAAQSAENIINKQYEMVINLEGFNCGEIYIINDNSLSQISQKLFGDWGRLQHELNIDYDNKYNKKIKNYTTYEENKRKYFKNIGSFSISYLNDVIKSSGDDEDKNIEGYFLSLCEEKNEKISNSYKNLEDLLKSQYPESKHLIQDQKSIDLIKSYLDAVKEWQHLLKPLLGTKREEQKDNRFYGEFNNLWDELDSMTSLYNKTRNYLTQKPYSEEKIKLNFKNSTLLDGWDLNKEEDNTCTLLKRGGNYYLVIMDKDNTKIMRELDYNNEEEYYEKLEYKLLPGPNKMLPKVFFSKKRYDEFSPSDEILKIRSKESFKKGDSFNKDDLHKMIDFYKVSLDNHEEWNNFGFQFKETKEYEDISQFYREVESQGYKISFRKISKNSIDKMVENGEIYLFQIYNKDYSKYSKGKKNLHTLYWEMIFDNENMKNPVYKLNGEAEVFYRKASVTNPVIHKANEPIDNKNKNNKKKQSTFAYDLVKNKRYTEDKFFLHVPITLNFNNKNINKINDLVREKIHKADEVYSIGIDRGERHLLYYSVVNKKGEIIEQGTLNEIKNIIENNEYTTNYYGLLKEKEAERQNARKDWASIENIKDLKAGYLSQIVHKLSRLMIKYNAILVLEDLNMGFMRGRQKFERQVYQQFERKMIEKLNYLVLKDIPKDQPGGLLHAYQLTIPFKSFKELGKQSGFLFYTQAWNTSKIDPTTGFVNLFGRIGKYENKDNARAFFNNFDEMIYNAEDGYFELKFDYNNFTQKGEGTKTEWTICSYGERIITYRDKENNNVWTNKTINLTNEIKALLEEYGIEYTKKEISNQIIEKNDAGLYKGMMELIGSILQMRNSNEENDYIISPVKNSDGEFFKSSKENPKLPIDADANGAYNIARKGQWIIEQIKNSSTEELDKVKLAMSNKDWLEYAQRG